jgi:hypothetical protein
MQNVGKTVHFPYIYRNLWGFGGFGGFVCVMRNVRVQKYIVQDGKCTETCTNIQRMSMVSGGSRPTKVFGLSHFV